MAREIHQLITPLPQPHSKRRSSEALVGTLLEPSLDWQAHQAMYYTAHTMMDV
jgi:hypothetical protein